VRINADKSFVMADIPGLIEGASEGVGLGHEFLRHVERCRLILHIVDVSGCEGRDPIEDFDLINRELENFSADLAGRPMLVAANKCDIATEEQRAAFRTEMEARGYRVFEISAAASQGTRPLIEAVAAELDRLPPVLRYEPDPLPLAPTKEDRRRFEITVEDGVYYIEAEWLPYILSGVNMEDYESLQYMQRILRSSGVIDKLEEMGINEGDTVCIDGFAFDYLR
ncbi:MAG: Obg family GTPase CgtA, partial [Oscillospiraceae bacterium]